MPTKIHDNNVELVKFSEAFAAKDYHRASAIAVNITQYSQLKTALQLVSINQRVPALVFILLSKEEQLNFNPEDLEKYLLALFTAYVVLRKTDELNLIFKNNKNAHRLIREPLKGWFCQGITPFDIASRLNDTNVIKLFFDVDADAINLIGKPVENGPYKGITLFFDLARLGQVEHLKLFFDRDPNAINLIAKPLDEGAYKGLTPFYIASLRGQADVIKFFCDLDPNAVKLIAKPLEEGSNKGSTPFSIASQNGLTDLIKLFCDLDPNAVKLIAKPLEEGPNKGLTPFSIASKNGLTDVIKLFCDLDPNAVKLIAKPFEEGPNKGLTPFYVASHNGLTDVITLFCELDPNAIKLIAKPFEESACKGLTLFYVAALKGQTDVITRFCELDANAIKLMAKPLEEGSNKGFTPFYIASQNGLTDLIKLFCDLDPNAVKLIAKPLEEGPNKGLTPFYIAALMGHADVIKRFCEHEAIISEMFPANEKNQAVRDFLKPYHDLFDALKNADFNLALSLINRPLKYLNVRNAEGDTYLQIAVTHAKQNPEQALMVVHALLHAGALRQTENKQGQRAIDIARAMNLTEIVSALACPYSEAIERHLFCYDFPELLVKILSGKYRLKQDSEIRIGKNVKLTSDTLAGYIEDRLEDIRSYQSMMPDLFDTSTAMKLDALAHRIESERNSFELDKNIIGCVPFYLSDHETLNLGPMLNNLCKLFAYYLHRAKPSIHENQTIMENDDSEQAAKRLKITNSQTSQQFGMFSIAHQRTAPGENQTAKRAKPST